MKQACLLLIVIALLTTSCSETSTSSTDPDKDKDTLEYKGDLLPLAVGNEWIYNYIGYNEAGEITSLKDDTLYVDIAYTGISYGFNNKTGGMILPDFVFGSWSIGEYGLYVFNDLIMKESLLAYPFPVDSSFTYIFQIEEHDIYIEIKVFKDEYVTIGLRIYKCYKYESRSKSANEGWFDYKYIHYFVPGIGIVKIEKMRLYKIVSGYYLEGLHELVEYRLFG